MAEYIERERARFEAKRYFKNLDEIQEDLDMIFCMLPAEDVVPVRHGRWKRYTKNLGECSNCGYVVSIRYKFCPNCGAKMRGSDDE